MIKIKYNNRNVWIDDNLKKDIAKREKLVIAMVKDPTDANKKAYTVLKNHVLGKQRKAERTYFREQFEMHSADLRKSWNVIKTLIGKSDKVSHQSQINFLINGTVTSDNAIIANSFNDYFVNVGRTLANKIICNDNPLSYITTNKTSITLQAINKHEIINIISNLNNSSAGHDDLQPNIMKQIVD